MISFDPVKDALNIENHGISLARFADMTDHVFVEDDRFDYGERRFLVFGLIDQRVYMAVVTFEGEQDEHVISLREAEQKEVLAYAKATSRHR